MEDLFKRLRTDTADISYPSGKLSFPAASYDKWSKDDNILLFNSFDNLEYFGILKKESKR